MPRTPAEVIALIQTLAARKTDIGVGACLQNAHNIYGIASNNTPTAAEAWARAKHRHPMSEPRPAGAFIFWGGGSIAKSTGKPAGHVAVGLDAATGLNGIIGSPGAPGLGTANRNWVVMGINALKHGWPQHGDPLGWTEDIDGVRIPGLAPAAAKVTSARPAKVQKAIDNLKAAKKEAARKPAQRKRLKKALGWLRKIGGRK